MLLNYSDVYSKLLILFLIDIAPVGLPTPLKVRLKKRAVEKGCRYTPYRALSYSHRDYAL